MIENNDWMFIMRLQKLIMTEPMVQGLEGFS